MVLNLLNEGRGGRNACHVVQPYRAYVLEGNRC